MYNCTCTCTLYLHVCTCTCRSLASTVDIHCTTYVNKMSPYSTVNTE